MMGCHAATWQQQQNKTKAHRRRTSCCKLRVEANVEVLVIAHFTVANGGRAE
jgi:hypothetical protein